MKILFDIGHPAHVHLFKNTIFLLKEKSHDVMITARDKDVSLNLLMAYGLPYINLGKNQPRIFSKALGMLRIDYELYNVAKKFQPDVLVGVHNPYIAHAGSLLNRSSITFTDTEHAKIANLITFPFTDVICTPSCFKTDLGYKQIRYNGYHEIAYLHPDYFTPDPSVLDELGLAQGEAFSILRFVAWGASHDIGQSGISKEMRLRFLHELEKYGKVLITSEKKLPEEFEPYRIRVEPEKFHSLLSYASLCISESCTVSEEAALLGTPSIHVSTLAKFIGIFDDLENNYDLVYLFDDDKQAFEKALKLLEDKNTKKKWQKKREKLFNEKINVTKFIVDFIERYPESFLEYKRNRSD